MKQISNIVFLFAFLFFSNCSQNFEPIIKSITAEPNPAQINEIVNLTCKAIDDDEENILKEELLQYEWFAAFGEIIFNSESNTASWETPENPGVYSVTCSVTDQYNGLDILSISITVQ
jgi:hypothetical protein